jgi:hypothetical protein
MFSTPRPGREATCCATKSSRCRCFAAIASEWTPRAICRPSSTTNVTETRPRSVLTRQQVPFFIPSFRLGEVFTVPVWRGHVLAVEKAEQVDLLVLYPGKQATSLNSSLCLFERNDLFQYFSGISIGVFGSVLIVFLIIFRYIPQVGQPPKQPPTYPPNQPTNQPTLIQAQFQRFSFFKRRKWRSSLWPAAGHSWPCR